MNNFQYYAPTKVVFGRGTEEQVGALVREQGARKVLLVYGGGSAVRSGLLSRVESCLLYAGVTTVTLGGVVPNPRLGKVREGIALAKSAKSDLILAVGGGSVIDTAKAIAYGIANEGDIWDYYSHKLAPRACAPVGVILTIAATGSEMSNSSVITNEEGALKRGLNTDLARPRFAILNPELTLTLPPYQTMSGASDILMHTMERYFSHEKDTALTDAIAEGLMKTVIAAARVVLHEPANYDARAELMWAGSLSHNGLTGCGRSGDWACHQLEHELGGMFDVAHGAGLTAIWGSWARYVMAADPERFAQFAVNVMGIPADPSDPAKVALAGIEALEAFFREIGMPTSLAALGLTLSDAQVRELAQKCSFFGTRTIGTFRVLQIADMENIYRLAK